MKKITATCFFIFLNLSLNAQNWDINTLKKINRLDNNSTKQYSKVIAGSTPYIVIGLPAAMGLYALIDKDELLLKDAIYIGTSVIEAAAISYGLKYAINRERPYDRYPDIIEKRDNEKDPSFPSNHTSTAFALATSLSIKYPKWYVITPSAIWACSVGFSRMNQGVHYPSDVITGALIGSGCAVANIYINKWLNKLLFQEKKNPSLVVY